MISFYFGLFFANATAPASASASASAPTPTEVAPSLPNIVVMTRMPDGVGDFKHAMSAAQCIKDHKPSLPVDVIVIGRSDPTNGQRAWLARFPIIRQTQNKLPIEIQEYVDETNGLTFSYISGALEIERSKMNPEDFVQMAIMEYMRFKQLPKCYLFPVSLSDITADNVKRLLERTGQKFFGILGEHDCRVGGTKEAAMGFEKYDEKGEVGGKLPGIFWPSVDTVCSSSFKCFGSVDLSASIWTDQKKKVLQYLAHSFGSRMEVRLVGCESDSALLLGEAVVLKDHIPIESWNSSKKNALFHLVDGDNAFQEALAAGAIPVFINPNKYPVYRSFLFLLDKKQCPIKIRAFVSASLNVIVSVAQNRPLTQCFSIDFTEEDVSQYRKVLSEIGQEFNVENWIKNRVNVLILALASAKQLAAEDQPEHQ